MNFKDFFIKHKKLITTVLSSIIVGTGIGIISSPSEAEYNNYLTKNTELLSKIDRLNTSIKANEISIEELTHKKSTLQLEKDKITKAKQKAEDEAVKKTKAEEEAELQAEEKAKPQDNFKANTEKSPEARSSTHSNSTPNSKKSTSNNSVKEPIGQMVWRTTTGNKYHSTNHCGNTNPSTASKISLSDAKANGLGQCSKCF